MLLVARCRTALICISALCLVSLSISASLCWPMTTGHRDREKASSLLRMWMSCLLRVQRVWGIWESSWERDSDHHQEQWGWDESWGLQVWWWLCLSCLWGMWRGGDLHSTGDKKAQEVFQGWEHGASVNSRHVEQGADWQVHQEGSWACWFWVERWEQWQQWKMSSGSKSSMRKSRRSPQHSMTCSRTQAWASDSLRAIGTGTYTHRPLRLPIRLLTMCLFSRCLTSGLSREMDSLRTILVRP